MDYKTIILGVACWLVAIWTFPMARKELEKGNITHLNIKGAIVAIILFVIGLYLIGKEISKTL